MTRTEAVILAEAIMLLTPAQASVETEDDTVHIHTVLPSNRYAEALGKWRDLSTPAETLGFLAEVNAVFARHAPAYQVDPVLREALVTVEHTMNQAKKGWMQQDELANALREAGNTHQANQAAFFARQHEADYKQYLEQYNDLIARGVTR